MMGTLGGLNQFLPSYKYNVQIKLSKNKQIKLTT